MPRSRKALGNGWEPSVRVQLHVSTSRNACTGNPYFLSCLHHSSIWQHSTRPRPTAQEMQAAYGHQRGRAHCLHIAERRGSHKCQGGVDALPPALVNALHDLPACVMHAQLSEERPNFCVACMQRCAHARKLRGGTHIVDKALQNGDARVQWIEER